MSKDSLSLHEMQSLPPDKQKELFNKLDSIRGKAKTVGFSALYNVGAETLSQTMGCSKKEAQLLLDTYWKRNWSVKRVAQEQKLRYIKREGGRVNGIWLWNPISRSYYYLRDAKDIFSTLNQSAGAYVFDCLLKILLSKRKQITAQFHDAVVLTVLKDRRAQVDKLFDDCVEELNNSLKLNVKISVDKKFGDNYGF